MKVACKTEIVNITKDGDFKKYLYRCLGGPPSKQYKKRIEYLKKAVPKGFHKKLLIFNGKVVGQIECAPAAASYYPIMGDNIIVMNCIWVLRKVKGHNFGKQLLDDMIRSEENASGFATIALENHWSPWFRKWQIENLGFRHIDFVKVSHKIKHKERRFTVYLMWMPMNENTKPPTWNEQKLLEGLTSCTAHPLYHPQTYRQKQILEKQ